MIQPSQKHINYTKPKMHCDNYGLFYHIPFLTLQSLQVYSYRSYMLQCKETLYEPPSYA